MLGKVSAITLIILGIYILANVFTGKNSKEEKPKSAELYHIGCYDIDRPLSHSQDINLYLTKLALLFNNTAPKRISTLRKKVSDSFFSQNGGNELARSFQKYIASYQNIKSRNQYQQSYFNTLRQTKDEFLECRDQFNLQPWPCRNVSHQYNTTDQHFKLLKSQIEVLMTKRAEHLNKTEELLKDEDVTKDAEYTEKFTKEIELNNEMIAREHQKIKQDNQTLLNVINDIFKTQIQLNSTQNILLQCQKNKEEIDFCNNISDYVRGLYDEVNLKQIERSMRHKRQIIDLIKAHIIQSRKLGEDVTSEEQDLEERKRQLEEEEALYHETNNTGKCAFELQIRCSPDNLIKLRNNLTLLTEKLITLNENKTNLQERLNKHLLSKNQRELLISHLTEQLKNSAVDIKHLKLKEERKKRQLEEYRNTFSQITNNITKANQKQAHLNLQRVGQIQKIHKIMQRGEELLGCLSKKELYLKLDAKKPKFTVEDEILKTQATQSLTGVIRKLLKQ